MNAGSSAGLAMREVSAPVGWGVNQGNEELAPLIMGEGKGSKFPFSYFKLISRGLFCAVASKIIPPLVMYQHHYCACILGDLTDG